MADDTFFGGAGVFTTLPGGGLGGFSAPVTPTSGIVSQTPSVTQIPLGAEYPVVPSASEPAAPTTSAPPTDGETEVSAPSLDVNKAFQSANPAPAAASGGANGGAGSTTILPNILGNYVQPTYHIRFLSRGDNGGSEVVIAESGVTGFNIKDLTFDSIVTHNSKTHNTIPTKYTMTITEPVGSSFLDAMVAATVKTGAVANWQKAPYWLEVCFKGYNENGAPNPNLCSSLPNGGVFKWRVSVDNMDTHLDASGGTYVLKGIQFAETALQDRLIRLTRPMAITATTVGEFFDKLKAALNKDATDNYGAGIYTYDFKFLNGPGGNPSAFKIISSGDNEQKDPYNLRGMANDARGQTSSNLTAKTSIPDIVLAVMGSTKEGQDLARDSQGKIKDDSLGTGEQRDSLIYRVYPDVKVTGYDKETGNYKVAIDFVIKGARIQGVFLKAEEIAPANSKKQIQAIQSYKGLSKRYDYIYSGLNTEVIDFDIKYNFAWQAILPRLQGAFFYNEQYVPSATYNAKQDDLAAQMGRARAQVAAGINAGQDNPTNITNSGIGGVNQAFGNLISGVGGVAAGVSSLAKAIPGAGGPLAGNSQVQTGPASGAGVKYAEDLLSQPVTTNPIQVSLTSSSDGARKTAGTGLMANWNRRKSIYGSILEQVEYKDQNQLSSIQLNIKGDPYWLGYDYEQMITEGDKAASLPDYSSGDICFILYFRYPYSVNDDGSPNLREQDVFNGLYKAVTLTHTFAGGQFKQTLKGYKLGNVEPGDIVNLK